METDTAIVGMSCRLPGASSFEEFWDLLLEGVDMVREVPPDRWSAAKFYSGTYDDPGKAATRWGTFLEEVGRFDAGFFGMAPEEAERVDPQQRLLLEATWHALEDAKIDPSSLEGTNCAVLVGISHNDYERIVYKELKGVCAFDGTGSYHSAAANRVSYTFGLTGPSFVVDSACSSVLSALHLARLLLNTGQCERAIVAGVNLNLTPEETLGLTKAKMLSLDGRCRSFDARGKGFVKGEGVGAFVLRRLSAARAEGDRVRAVVKGSAMNHNGRSNGLSAPKGPAQQDVIRQALDSAGVEPGDVGYVEAHGTGTELGDPVEFRALNDVLRKNRVSEQLCWLGSCKTNIGHLEASSGVASLVKVVLATERRMIPKNLHFEEPNRYLNYENGCLRVPVQHQEWSCENRIAAVSAFGFGGANGHVIVGSSPVVRENLTQSSSKEQENGLVLIFSTRSSTALLNLASLHEAALGSEQDVHSYCLASRLGRSNFAHRMAVVGNSCEELREALRRRIVDGHHPSVLEFEAARRSKLGLLLSAEEFQRLVRGDRLAWGKQVAVCLDEVGVSPEIVGFRSPRTGELFELVWNELETDGKSIASSTGQRVSWLRLGASPDDRGFSPQGGCLDVDLHPSADLLESRTLKNRLWAAAYVLGANICWPGGWSPSARNAKLPFYPFEGDVHWVRPAETDVPYAQYGSTRYLDGQ